MTRNAVLMTVAISMMVLGSTIAVGGYAFNSADAEHNSAYRHQLNLRAEKMSDRAVELDAREERVAWLEHADAWFLDFEPYITGIDTYTVLTPEGRQFVAEFQQLVLEAKNFRAEYDDNYRLLLEENDALRKQIAQSGAGDAEGGNASACSATGAHTEQVTLPADNAWTGWVGAETGQPASYVFCAPAGTEVFASNGNYYPTSETLVLTGPVALRGTAGASATVYWTLQ